MTKDGLEDLDNLCTDMKMDNVSTGHLRMAQPVSFSELCAYTVELPFSEHWRPKVKVAKKAEIKNLLDYETFEEVKDKGQMTVGSRWVITEKEVNMDKSRNAKQ